MMNFAYRCRKGIAYCPTEPQTITDQSAAHPELPSPLRYRQSDTNMRNESVCALIVGLFLSRCPAAIFWRISIIVITALNRVSARLLAHVSEEILERIQPTLTNGNTSSAIVGKPWLRNNASRLAYCTAILAMLATTPLFAIEPRAEMSGDTTVLVGQIARKTAALSRDAFRYAWQIAPKPLSCIKVEGGREIHIGHNKTQSFAITLIVTSADGELDMSESTLDFIGPPEPKPLSTAQELPEILEEEDPAPVDLQSEVLKALILVRSDHAPADAGRMTPCVDQELAALEGGLTTPERMIGDLGVHCKAVLGDSWPSWIPFFRALGLRFDTMAEARQLETNEDYAEALRILSEALAEFSRKP